MLVEPPAEDVADGHHLFWIATDMGPWVMRWLSNAGGWQMHGDARLISPQDAKNMDWVYIGKAIFAPCPTCLSNGWLRPFMSEERVTCPTCLGDGAVTGGEISAPFRELIRKSLNDSLVVLELETSDPYVSDIQLYKIESDIKRLKVLCDLYQ